MPASLFGEISTEITVFNISVRGRAIHIVQHIIGRDADLNVKRFADRPDREILEEICVPIVLAIAPERVTPERTDHRTTAVRRTVTIVTTCIR